MRFTKEFNLSVRCVRCGAKLDCALEDGTKDVFNVRANDDVEARAKAVKELQTAHEEVEGKFVGIDFCEIEWVCDIHAG